MVKTKKRTTKSKTIPQIKEVKMTPENTRVVKIPLAAAVFFSLFLVCAAFFLGAMVTKVGNKSTTTAELTSANSFAVTKSDKPEFFFYVMSFCPYGNQMETALRPVFDAIGNKVELQPHYIFEKITDLKTSCKAMSGDATQCAAYVQNKYFPDEATCKKTIADNTTKCMDENSYIKSGDSFYASLHGRQEANQDVREICAYNMLTDKKPWWDFVANVNQACTAQNADSCWEEQAKKAGLDTGKITECFNKDAINLIEKEIALTTANKVQGSPTLTVNGSQFPPETAYAQDGKGTIAVGKKVFTQDQYRLPNTIKEAICSGFKKAPKECQKEIANNTAPSNAAAAGGGCH